MDLSAIALTNEDYLEFIERKRKEGDILYKFFDYAEMPTKRHYLKEFIENTLKKTYQNDGNSNNSPRYVFTDRHWGILEKLVDSNDANILDMLWFFAVIKFDGVYEWMVKGDAENGHKSYIHDVGRFNVFLERFVRPSFARFLDGNANYTVRTTIRSLRSLYIQTCGFPCKPVEWRREFMKSVKKREKSLYLEGEPSIQRQQQKRLTMEDHEDETTERDIKKKRKI